MKLFTILFIILLGLGVIVAAEFSDEGSVLFPVKTQVNDRLHVYRSIGDTQQNVVTDALEIDAATKDQLNKLFPKDMEAFIVRFEARNALLRTAIETGVQTASSSEQLAETKAINDILVAAKTKLATGEAAYAEVENMVIEAIDRYLAVRDAQ